MFLSTSTSNLFDATQGLGIEQATAFTFFVGTMAMMAASAFFFFEIRNVGEKWRTSVLVSGLITFIAAVHYYYMRDYFINTGTSPTFFRYVDWLLTVPLMCVEFYLITKLFTNNISFHEFCRRINFQTKSFKQYIKVIFELYQSRNTMVF
jgi:undecaprenyl pyrophosphate phosphatase UppP